MKLYYMANDNGRIALIDMDGEDDIQMTYAANSQEELERMENLLSDIERLFSVKMITIYIFFTYSMLRNGDSCAKGAEKWKEKWNRHHTK